MLLTIINTWHFSLSEIWILILNLKTMKKQFQVLAIILVSFLFTSCGVNQAYLLNSNQNNTQVNLSSNNFKVTDKISGSAEVSYILIFGGLNKKKLYENAYSDMMNKANLLNTSKAVINIVTEEHVGGVPPFYFKRTVTVSANVIEFVK